MPVYEYANRRSGDEPNREIVLFSNDVKKGGNAFGREVYLFRCTSRRKSFPCYFILYFITQ